MLWEISQNSQENTCVRVSFLTKLQISACNFIKKSLQHRCFPVNLAKFLRAPFLQNTSGQLLFDLNTYIRLMLKDIYFFFNKYQKQLPWGPAKIKSFEKSCEIHWIKYQETASIYYYPPWFISSRLGVFYRDFCWSLFFNKVTGLCKPPENLFRYDGIKYWAVYMNIQNLCVYKVTTSIEKRINFVFKERYNFCQN